MEAFTENNASFKKHNVIFKNGFRRNVLNSIVDH